MLSSQPGGAASRLRRVLAIGCHADDIEIGCGGTLLTLTREHPGRSQSTGSCSAAPGEREPRRGRARRCSSRGAGAPRVEVHGFRDGYLPYLGAEVKERLRGTEARGPTRKLILTHTRDDLHQDHRLACELTWNTFRDHLILEYEIPKCDGDLGTPNLFVPLDEEVAEREGRARLHRHFPSQAEKHWFDEDTFRGLMRLRGIECALRSAYAEAFFAPKVVIAP